MPSNNLLASMALYHEAWGGVDIYQTVLETAVLSRFRRFVGETPAPFARTTLEGHLTGSALVVSADFTHVLLTLHRKLGKWLQLGGHADGEPYLHAVAMREAQEESGLTSLSFLSYEHALTALALEQPLPFDFDCHEIPARTLEPAHVHYDVRYLMIADRQEPLVISAESKDLRWFSLTAAREVAPEASMARQFDKLEWLRPRLTEPHKALG